MVFPNLMTKFTEDDISKIIVDCAYAVHKSLGPGLLESSYECCMAYEMEKRGLSFERQLPLPIDYDGHKIETAYRLDFLVENEIIIELKAVDKMQPIHLAQIMTYLRHSKIKTGLLINFNTQYFKEGIKRISM
jgi:GxxExxY protein